MAERRVGRAAAAGAIVGPGPDEAGVQEDVGRRGDHGAPTPAVAGQGTVLVLGAARLGQAVARDARWLRAGPGTGLGTLLLAGGWTGRGVGLIEEGVCRDLGLRGHHGAGAAVARAGAKAVPLVLALLPIGVFCMAFADEAGGEDGKASRTAVEVRKPTDWYSDDSLSGAKRVAEAREMSLEVVERIDKVLQTVRFALATAASVAVFIVLVGLF